MGANVVGIRSASKMGSPISTQTWPSSSRLGWMSPAAKQLQLNHVHQLFPGNLDKRHRRLRWDMSVTSLRLLDCLGNSKQVLPD